MYEQQKYRNTQMQAKSKSQRLIIKLCAQRIKVQRDHALSHAPDSEEARQ